MRLAEEYDAAQERGEVGQSGARTDLVPRGNEVAPTAADLGLTRKAIHEARTVRDAERAEPGVILGNSQNVPHEHTLHHGGAKCRRGRQLLGSAHISPDPGKT